MKKKSGNEKAMRNIIQHWRSKHRDDPTRGLDELMDVIEQVYEHVQPEVESRHEEPQMNDYGQLRNAVQDLLAELRIDPRSLEVMAIGFSPDYPGAVDTNWKNPHCKVQLSQVVARKLRDAGV